MLSKHYQKSAFATLPKRNAVGVVLLIASLVVLYPGLTQPMMNLTIQAALPLLGKVEFYNNTQSILQSIQSLFDSDNVLVAILILLFSVVVPVLKALLLVGAVALPAGRVGGIMHRCVSLIGKWSMADVFVVGVFMAYLAGQAHPNAQATLHAGFYYFTGYCVLSIASAQVIKTRSSFK